MLFASLIALLFSCGEFKPIDFYTLEEKEEDRRRAEEALSSSSEVVGDLSSSSVGVDNIDPSLSSAAEDSSSSSSDGEEAGDSSSSVEKQGDSSSSLEEADSSSSAEEVGGDGSSSSDNDEIGGSSSSEGEEPEASSSSSSVPEPLISGSLFFTNLDYEEDEVYYIGSMPDVYEGLVVTNPSAAKCTEESIRYERTPFNLSTNLPGQIKVCAKRICNDEDKVLQCIEATVVPDFSFSGTCEWSEPVLTPEKISEEIASQFAVENNYGRCVEPFLSLDNGKTVWTPVWKADSANITNAKVYAKCGNNLIGGVACPVVKLKNPKATGYFVDDGDGRDGQAYQFVRIQIGDYDKTWMAENLNYNVSGSLCYDGNTNNCTKYGRLYDWETAKEVCPEGWHLPNDTEWDDLTTAVGGTDTGGRTGAGKILKAMSGWSSNGNGDDNYGFSALPGGRYSNDFIYVNDYGYWWSATQTQSDDNLVWNRNMSYSIADVGRYDVAKSSLRSVRCVMD